MVPESKNAIIYGPGGAAGPLVVSRQTRATSRSHPATPPNSGPSI